MTMRAATVSRFGGPEAVEITEHPLPVPGEGQVRIKVKAAAINPVDVAMRSGVFGGQGPVGLGFDVAGVVDTVGPGADWKVGERVFAVVTGHHKPLGTHADHIVVDAGILAPSPASLDDVHAATLPLNATTASQVFDLLDLSAGQSLLVVGANGGVGAHATELAYQRGWKVTGTAAACEDFVRARGADHFLARDETPEPASFDGVLDTASLGAAALAAVRDGGAYAGLWPGSEPTTEQSAARGSLLSPLTGQGRPGGERSARAESQESQGWDARSRKTRFSVSVQAFLHGCRPGAAGAGTSCRTRPISGSARNSRAFCIWDDSRGRVPAPPWTPPTADNWPSRPSSSSA
ncbi:hypothetical protein AQJ11_38030 [Streptomyces corchorusii]|uniref:Enoyl reductase (ER) domain-containing protein n=2 Tax=Streptomyces TaxID=1883 RepID=A0A101PTY5_STRCK|nr:NADP-dependent oxidoreductase [Streptomyces corchorusii]KUN17659.1 hypothetical protein AQJ11_38030 [Streptomyces corchorusii]